MVRKRIALTMLVLAVLALGALPAAATSTLITILNGNPRRDYFGGCCQPEHRVDRYGQRRFAHA